MSITKDNYYKKYLKYKQKYIQLKKQFGGVHNCDTTLGDNRLISNIYKTTCGILRNMDQDYSFTKGATENPRNSDKCNLWVWNKMVPSPPNNRNHIDIYYLNIVKYDYSIYNEFNNIQYVEFCFTSKKNNISLRPSHTLTIHFQNSSQYEVAQELATKIEELYYSTIVN